MEDPSYTKDQIKRAIDLFELLQINLKKVYINGSWKYQTIAGNKTREGIIEMILKVMFDEEY